MKGSGLVILMLVLAGALIAGCTQNPLPIVSPPTTQITTVVTTPTVSLPSFTLGDVYFNEPYGYIFNSRTDRIERSFIVDSPAWGIDLKVISTNNESINNSWFVMDVINTNSKKSDSFGYGGNFSFTEKQLIPMYNQGPYKITMKGDQVKVWFTVAKRNP